MLTFLLRRFLSAIPTLLLSSLLIFFIIQLAPGDFLTPARLNPNITPEHIAALQRNLGLDQPTPVQYWRWLTNMFRGDFGESFAYQQSVLALAWPRILNSMCLVLPYLILYYLIAIPLGVYGALRQNSLGDKVTNVVMYILLGFPSFFLALLVIFGLLQLRYATGWDIPINGMTSDNYLSLSPLGKFLDIAKHVAIPALVLAISDAAGLTRVVRGQMLEFLHADFVRTARSKGVTEFSAVYRHTLRNALVPIIAGLGGLLPAVISGAGFIEVVFAYPGITPMTLDAIASQDLFLIAGVTMLSVILLIIGNVLADILLSVVDPRIRYA
ncbi:ABC transporter permease [Deinococcus apachensis]|uniref:ABC transporter permease n=1 Tax=Deinococcus apachensis TaxID=309886 RepID=UPI000376D296|nr:ABC transporter permease [Deinococcus apachensis]